MQSDTSPLFFLLASLKRRDPEVIRALANASFGTRRPLSGRGNEISDADLDRIAQDLSRQVASGQMHCAKVDPLEKLYVRDVPAPPPAPAPEPPEEAAPDTPPAAPVEEKKTTWFEVKVVDEKKVPLTDITVIYQIGDTTHEVPCNDQGIARLENAEGNEAGVRLKFPDKSETDTSGAEQDSAGETAPAQKIQCDFVEIPDILFHHGSAVPCLDEKGTLIGSLTATLGFAHDNPDKEAVLFGHADTSGDPGYNYDLSQWRSEGIKALLDNNTDAWLDEIDLASKVEDYQATLKALSASHGWPCDPGAVDNASGPKTKSAIKTFQEEYNSRFKASLKPDGIIGPKTWTAIFTVLHDLLTNAVAAQTKETSVPKLTYGHNGSGIYPCGESFPIEAAEKDNYTSATNRRVEIVFFDKGKAPELKTPADKKKVEKTDAPVYDPDKTKKTPIPPVPAATTGASPGVLLLEFAFPVVNNPDRPHKQYVNLDSNGKNEGMELTLRVKPKDIKADITNRRVFWKVTAHDTNSKRTDPKTGIKTEASSKLIEFTDRIATAESTFSGRESSLILACGVAGGDRFTVEAGSDGKEYPIKVMVENWRKLWYQLTHHSSITPPSMTTPTNKLEKVFIEFLAETPNKHSKVNAGNVIVGNHNQAEYHKLFSALNKNICCHIILCDKQFDGVDSRGNNLTSAESKDFTSTTDSILMSKKKPKRKIFNPPLQSSAKFLVQGKWKSKTNKKSGTLTDNPAKVSPNIGLVTFIDSDFITVDLPKNAKPSAANPVTVTVEVTAANGPWGGDGSVSPHNLVVIDSNDTIHSQCVLHELGHLMKMVPYTGYFDCPPGFNYSDHTKKYIEMGGSGSHCSYNIDKTKSTSVLFVDGRCIMFHQLNRNCELIYCPDCAPFVKAQSLSKLK
ncbi:MAG: peptidoglycan-binding protein [Chitinispirillaceae bacterium]|nr:peptidoglycan-binding protein [Chitinispirillaceae bacterium]